MSEAPRRTNFGFAFSELFVDLLGSLVPGVLFTFLASVCLLWPAIAAFYAVHLPIDLSSSVSLAAFQAVTAFRFEIVVFMLAFSYVVGHFFARQDPKLPDEKSFRRTNPVPGTDPVFGPQDGMVRYEKDEFGKIVADVQFPYKFLKSYLSTRGLDHLADLVLWDGSSSQLQKKRSKAFVNILKTRLHFHYPEHYGQIARNEAHVRLASSIWYASRTLTYVAAGGGLIGSTAIVGALFSDHQAAIVPAIWTIPPLFVLVASSWTQAIIERFIHYQRVREVIYVLETAYTAVQDPKDILKNFD